MSGVITTGAHPKLLWPGVKAIWGTKYAEHVEEWSKLVDKDTSDKNFEDDVQVLGFGVVPVKAQGARIQFDTEIQGFTTRYTHLAYALGYIVTYEELADNLYMEVSKRRAANLAFAFRQTKEQVVANVYNRAFNSTYVGGDNVSLGHTAHPQAAGGTWSNRADADLSEVALEDMLVKIMTAQDDKGHMINLMPRSLVVTAQRWFDANRILKSVYQPGTVNNDISVINATNAFPEGIMMSHYISANPQAWFIRTNAQNGLKLYQREAISFSQDNDFDTKNAKAASYERYSVGWTDPRALYGSNGP